MSEDNIGLDEFIAAMGSVCTPVSVVTAMDEEAARGTTVSAFASLSAEPPMVLVSMDKRSRILPVILRRQAFGLNVLASDSQGLARNFASKKEDKFEDVDWLETPYGPRLKASTVWAGCHLSEAVEGGDHVVLFGLLKDTAIRPAPPLMYHLRQFGSFVPSAAEHQSMATATAHSS